MKLLPLFTFALLGVVHLTAAPLFAAGVRERGSVNASANAAQEVAIAADRLREARAALARAENTRERIRALTDAISSYEVALAQLRAELRRLAVRSRRLEAVIAARQQDNAALLASLLAIARTPPPGLLAHPDGPVAAARAAMLLEDTRARIREETASILAARLEAEKLRRAREETAGEITAALAEMQEARIRLAEAVAERRRGKLMPLDAALLGELARTATTLDEFADSLASRSERGREKGSARPLPEERPRLPRGARILYRSGEADAAGIRRPGLVLALAPGTLLTSPLDATVRYAGPLARYGNVIVLEPTPDRLIVLSGLDVLYADTGDILARGDPLGIVGTDATADVTSSGDAVSTTAPAGKAGSLNDEANEGSPLYELPATATLYLELRKRGKPVDPLSWFTLSKD